MQVLPAILDSMPLRAALKLAVFAATKELVNLEKWLEEKVTIHRDSFAAACLSFLQGNCMVDEMSAVIEHSENLPSDIYGIILKVRHYGLYSSVAF